MAWRGSLSRSLMSTARASAFRSSPSLSAPRRLRPPPLSAPRLQQRRLSFSNPRVEWKRWVMSAALPNDQRQSPDTALYLTILLDSAELMLKDLVLGH